MLIAFNFTRIAVVVRRWFEITPDALMEHGSRVELRLLEPQRHRGSDSAAQKTVINAAFWRADLFNGLGRATNAFSAADYHPRFEGNEPSDRVWSKDLSAAPWRWLTEQLTAIEDRLRYAGLDPILAADDADDIRAFVPQIIRTARQFSPEHPSTRDKDFSLAKDAAERVQLMLAHIPDQPQSTTTTCGPGSGSGYESTGTAARRVR